MKRLPTFCAIWGALVLMGCSGSDSFPAGSGGASEACEYFAERQGIEVEYVGGMRSLPDDRVDVSLSVRPEGLGPDSNVTRSVTCLVQLRDGRWWLLILDTSSVR